MLRKGMRGTDQPPSQMFSYLSPVTRVRKNHALRAVRRMVDEVLGALSPQFDRIVRARRAAVAREKLLWT